MLFRRKRFAVLLSFCLLGVAVLVAPATPARADAADAVRDRLVFGDYARQVRENPDAALAEIDAAIAVMAEDPRVLVDLVGLKADAQAGRGDVLAQALSLRDLALLARRHRALLGRDPVPDLDVASTIFEDLGELRAALDLVLVLIDELRAAGTPASGLAPAYERAARLHAALGDNQAADRASATAAELRRVMASGDSATRSADTGFEVVEVFYATDRKRTGHSHPARFYGGDRGDLEYGTLEVTIPKTHRVGALELPSVWRLEFAPDPARHVVLRSVTPVAGGQFFSDMRDRMDQIGRADAIVFVHGYNVTFEGAALRTAQLAYDPGFSGVPILYSWPSQGATSGYLSDTAVVRLSGRRLTRFLEDLVAQSGAETIHLVAHSMGSRAMADALELLALRRGPDAATPFGQVVFAAPDLDAGLFREMMPTIRGLAKRVTLYSSDADWALIASRKLHGNAPRAGQGGQDALGLPGVDTIDMSDLGEDMLAHSYVANDSSALLDLVSLFWKNLDPDRRCGVSATRSDNGVTVWKYTPGRCSDTMLIGLLATLIQQRAETSDQVERLIATNLGDAALPGEVLAEVKRMLEN